MNGRMRSGYEGCIWQHFLVQHTWPRVSSYTLNRHQVIVGAAVVTALSRYHCLGMLLLTLSAWAVDLPLSQSELPHFQNRSPKFSTVPDALFLQAVIYKVFPSSSRKVREKAELL